MGRDEVSDEWTDTAVGPGRQPRPHRDASDPDGHGRLEYLPDPIETAPTQPNEIGMHRVAFSVDDLDDALRVAARHGYHPLRGVANDQDAYRLTYLRGPRGTIVMLAQDLTKGRDD